MTKAIAFWIADAGIDGREPKKIVYASFSEPERDEMFAADKNKNWRHKGEQIINVEVAKKEALAKLNGIDRLVLGIKQS
jgi:hypothetical protein